MKSRWMKARKPILSLADQTARPYHLKSLWGLFFCLMLMACQSPGLQTKEPSALACKNAPHIGRTIWLTSESPPLETSLEPGEVILTFDAGPDPHRTLPVLAILAEHCITAAFFLRGDQAQQNPELVEQILTAGHTVGSHTYSHPRLVDLAPDDAKREIVTGRDAVAQAAGGSTKFDTTTFFRYTYLQSSEHLETIIEDLGLIIIGANASGQDWLTTTPDAIFQNIKLDLARNGDRGVVLLHDPFFNSDRSLELVVRELKLAGHKFVSFRAEGPTPPPNKVH